LFYRLEDRRVRRFFLGGKHPREQELRQVLQALMRAESARVQELARTTGLSEKRIRVICAELESRHVIRRRGSARVVIRRMKEDEIGAFLGAFESHFRADEDRLRAMMDYAESARCRVQFLREYFGELPGEKCGRCDNYRTPVRATATTASVTPTAVSGTTPAPGQKPVRRRLARPRAGLVPAPEPNESTGAARDKFQVRQEVQHKRFGRGEVVGVVGDEIEVAFARYGRRRVLAGYLS
jgi:ATP-dependent DNA helicase RecQ